MRTLKVLLGTMLALLFASVLVAAPFTQGGGLGGGGGGGASFPLVCSSNGTAAAPCYANPTGSTGIYFGTNEIDFSVAGVNYGVLSGGQTSYGSGNTNTKYSLGSSNTSTSLADSNTIVGTANTLVSTGTVQAGNNTVIGNTNSLTRCDGCAYMGDLGTFTILTGGGPLTIFGMGEGNVVNITTNVGAEVTTVGFDNNYSGPGGFLQMIGMGLAPAAMSEGGAKAYFGFGNSVTSLPDAYVLVDGISGVITTVATSGTRISGTNTNDNAAAGFVGQIITSSVPSASSVSMTSPNALNVTSVSLTAGDWDCNGNADYTAGGATTFTVMKQGISTTSATIGAADTFSNLAIAGTLAAASDLSQPTPVVRQSLSATTTVFLVAQSTFAVSTLKAYGTLRCRRMR